MMKPEKTQCIKHIFEFYTDNGKGVAPTLNKLILEYPIDPNPIQNGVDALYRDTAIRARFDQTTFSFHKKTESLKW